MHQISLNHLARNKPVEPLVEKEVQMRAYELYEQRGKGQGFALQDWLQAEAEVMDRLSSSLPGSSTFVKEL
jgi:Protein of unknown function (DUF2934)